jgi:transcriptional regulator with XRE-family HTH domain
MQIQENNSEDEKLRLEVASRLDFVIRNYFKGRNIELSRATGGQIPESAISRWRSGKSLPELRTIAAIEDKAGISLDWMMKGEGNITAQNERGQTLELMTSIDKGILKAKNSVEEAESATLEIEQDMYFAKLLLKERAAKLGKLDPFLPEPTNVSSPIQKFKSGRIRVYLTPANAGRGFTLDDAPDGEDYRPLYNNNDDIIVVPVSGNSMEPGIMSGDKVYVDTSRVEPRNGETVLCHVDGVNYVKFYFKDTEGRTWLASANKEYEAFEINGFNSSKVYGVVIEVARTPTRADMKEYSFPIGQSMFESY